MGFIEWFTRPLVDTARAFKDELVEDLQTKEKEVHLEQGNKVVLFRPTNFSQYIGQERAKSILLSYIEGTKARDRIFPHVLIHGFAGCGKTTLAKIIAHELGVPFKELIASSAKSSVEVLSQILELQTMGKNGILFVDEIHGLPRDLVEVLYPIMEDFQFQGIDIKPFTMIGATTEYGELLEDRRPFVDRFKIPIELEPYQPSELAELIRQYNLQMFPQEILPRTTCGMISKNARLTPRIGIRLLEATIYLNGNINQALSNFGIIQDGLTHKDFKVLEYININDKGVGIQALSSYLGTPASSFLYDIEPFLLQNKYILRTSRGRKITDIGKQKLSELRIIIHKYNTIAK